jgi:hypothetical protein
MGLAFDSGVVVDFGVDLVVAVAVALELKVYQSNARACACS